MRKTPGATQSGSSQPARYRIRHTEWKNGKKRPEAKWGWKEATTVLL